MPVAAVLSPAGAINIVGLTAESAIVTGDSIPFYDTSAGANRRVLYGDLQTAINALVSAQVSAVENDFDALETSTSAQFAALQASVNSALASSLRGYIDGLTLSNNGADASNDIDIAAGVARDSGNTVTLSLNSTLVKRSDAAWAVGSNAGGMDTGSKPTSGTLHVYLISNGTTTDAVFSTNAAAPTLPTGYTTYRRIGSVLTDGSGNLLGFVQVGDEFVLTTRALDRDAVNVGTTAVLQALSVPAGLQVRARFQLRLSSGGVDAYAYATSPLATDQAPGAGGAINLADAVSTASFNQFNELERLTNTSRQVRLRATSTIPVSVLTSGWVDNRGKR